MSDNELLNARCAYCGHLHGPEGCDLLTCNCAGARQHDDWGAGTGTEDDK